jgi:hypothetical protein
MKSKKLLIMNLSLVIFISLFYSDVFSASKKTFWYNVKPATMGEFNFSSKGKGNSTAQLYKIGFLGKKTKVSATKYIKSKNNFKIQSSLRKNTKYSLKVTYTGAKPSISYGRNYDYYSNSNKVCKKCISWQPISGSYQPYSLQGIETRQIIYLTREEAAIYSICISKSKYLKCLDTSIKLTYIISTWGISSKSKLAKILKDLGKNKIASMMKAVASTYGGWSLIPSIRKSVANTIDKKTSGFKYGLKVVVTYSDRGGFSNTYTKWDGKYSSIKGKEFCRGKFSVSCKVKGWY